MTQEKPVLTVLTPTFTVAFPSVFEIDKGYLSKFDKERYTIQMLFEKSEKAKLDKMMKIVDEAIKEKWPEKTPRNLRLPELVDGSEKESEKMHDYYILSVNSSRKPSLVDQEKNEITDKTLFYAGCKARAFISAYAYDKKSLGVSLSLVKLQKVSEGKAFGFDDSAYDFDKVEIEDMQGDIPF